MTLLLVQHSALSCRVLQEYTIYTLCLMWLMLINDDNDDDDDEDFQQHSPISFKQRVGDLSETQSFLAVH